VKGEGFCKAVSIGQGAGGCHGVDCIRHVPKYHIHGGPFTARCFSHREGGAIAVTIYWDRVHAGILFLYKDCLLVLLAWVTAWPGCGRLHHKLHREVGNGVTVLVLHAHCNKTCKAQDHSLKESSVVISANDDLKVILNYLAENDGIQIDSYTSDKQASTFILERSDSGVMAKDVNGIVLYKAVSEEQGGISVYGKENELVKHFSPNMVHAMMDNMGVQYN
jgi:hypothetical protein